MESEPVYNNDGMYPLPCYPNVRQHGVYGGRWIPPVKLGDLVMVKHRPGSRSPERIDFGTVVALTRTRILVEYPTSNGTRIKYVRLDDLELLNSSPPITIIPEHHTYDNPREGDPKQIWG